jgi:hypothetical protein
MVLIFYCYGLIENFGVEIQARIWANAADYPDYISIA